MLLFAAPASAADLDVRLTVERLALVRWGRSEEAALDGAVGVDVTNRGAEPARLRGLGEHGLVFTNVATGEEHVVLHSCLCVEEATHRDARAVTIAPGATWHLAVDDWGCAGSSWAAPAPGEWTLAYRVLPLPEGAPPAADPDVKRVLASCRADLLDPAAWAGATVSAPVPVTLGPPKRRRVPR